MATNIPVVYIEEEGDFGIEVYVDAIGTIKISVSMEDTYGTLESDRVLERDKLKSIIDGLTTIYDGTAKENK